MVGGTVNAQTAENGTATNSRTTVGKTLPISYANTTWTASSSLQYTSTITSQTTTTNSTASEVHSSLTEETSTSSDTVVVTVTSTDTAITSTAISSWNDPAYSISFSPPYWFCSDVSVTFTGPLLQSGYYGDTLQFQYYQYNPSYPSVLTPIFSDNDLTVTSDTVSYWVGFGEYAQVNFAYQPYVAIKVIDLTPTSNGYPPGLIFFQLTNITPQSLQYCTNFDPNPVPEFQLQWLVIVASIILSLGFLTIRKRHHLG